MKVLIVSSGNSGGISSFVHEQAIELEKFNIAISHFLIKGKGISGYLMNKGKLKKVINEFSPNIIHAHYGLSGLLANLQRKVPVVTTYHGCDINNPWIFPLSWIAMRLSRYNIFVSSKLALRAKAKKEYSIIPCGVDLSNFKVCDKIESKNKLGLKAKKKYVLFASAFSVKVKNYPLAAKAIEILTSNGYNIELIELSGYDRATVNTLMNAVDCVLVTSFRESGPLVIKEAMAVNNCAVSVDVGDVHEITKNLKGYYLTSSNPESVSSGIIQAIEFSQRHFSTDGRSRIIELGLDTISVAEKIIKIYSSIVD